MQAFTILEIKMFCSTTKTLLLNYIPSSYPKHFVLCKRDEYNGTSLEVYAPFHFQPVTHSMRLFFFFNSNVLRFSQYIDII